MTGCNWQCADAFEFTDLDGPLVIGIDGRDAGGIGGIMANVNVGGMDYTSGSAWRCWQTETQTELSGHDMQLWGDGGFDQPLTKEPFFCVPSLSSRIFCTHVKRVAGD